jgi:hypothetical protein
MSPPRPLDCHSLFSSLYPRAIRQKFAGLGNQSGQTGPHFVEAK